MSSVFFTLGCCAYYAWKGIGSFVPQFLTMSCCPYSDPKGIASKFLSILTAFRPASHGQERGRGDINSALQVSCVSSQSDPSYILRTHPVTSAYVSLTWHCGIIPSLGWEGPPYSSLLLSSRCDVTVSSRDSSSRRKCFKGLITWSWKDQAEELQWHRP